MRQYPTPGMIAVAGAATLPDATPRRDQPRDDCTGGCAPRLVAAVLAYAIAQRCRVAMAKNTAVAACHHVVDNAVQLHGGMGYMRESEVERHYRDSGFVGIGDGTNEIMTEIVARLVPA